MTTKRPIAITIGTDDDHILARADNDAVRAGVVQILDFVRIGSTIGRIVRVSDAHDFSRDTEIVRIARDCLKSKAPAPEVQEMVYKKLTIPDIFEQFSSSVAQKQLWTYMRNREPRRFIEILSNYDITDDPFKLKRETVKHKDTDTTTTTGVAIVPTIDTVCRQARILEAHVDVSAPRTISKIVGELKQGKVVLANTFNTQKRHPKQEEVSC